MRTRSYLTKLSLTLLAPVLMTSCNKTGSELPAEPTTLPPLTKALTCLRGSGPIIAAHRGRDKFTNRPENSIDSLARLKKAGFVIAEVDVARLKDGTHILHHDGVWDDTTNGTGIVASTTWDTAQTYLLRRRGRGTVSERVPSLEQALSWAGGDFYLELDIKSSADPDAIIKTVKSAGMSNHIILIAYTDAQARSLKRLTAKHDRPDILISSPAAKAKVYWLGTKTFNVKNAAASQAAGNFPAFGMMSPKYAKRANYSALSILVSDYPPEAKAKAKTRGKDRARIEACDL